MADIFMVYSFNHNWLILRSSRNCFYIVFKTSAHCPLDWKLPFSLSYTYWIKFISKKRIRGIRRKTNNLKTKIETDSWYTKRRVSLLLVLRNLELKFQVKILNISMRWKFAKAVLSVLWKRQRSCCYVFGESVISFELWM